jgi:hypothetical protein
MLVVRAEPLALPSRRVKSRGASSRAAACRGGAGGYQPPGARLSVTMNSPSGSCRQRRGCDPRRALRRPGTRRALGSPPSFLPLRCWQRSHGRPVRVRSAPVPAVWAFRTRCSRSRPAAARSTLRDSSLGAKLRDSTTLSCRHHYEGGIFSVRVSRYRTPALAARQFGSLCKRARPAAIGSHSCLQDLRFIANSGFGYPHLRDAVALDGARVVGVGTSSNPPPASLGFHLRAVKYLLPPA